MTEKRLTVILFGSDRNLWGGGPLRFRVTDVFAAGGPKLLHEGKTESSTLDLRLQLPFDAGQIYGFDFTAPGHHPAWQLVRRSDFIRQPEGTEGDDVILRLMLVPDKPGTRDLAQGFERLRQRASPVVADGGGLDEETYRELGVANRMALLNIEAKLRETIVDGTPLLSFVKAVRHVAVDRLFLLVDASLKDRLARAITQYAVQSCLSPLFCLASDSICLHPSAFRKSARLSGLIFSTILPVSYAAGPLAAYPRRSVIA